MSKFILSTGLVVLWVLCSLSVRAEGLDEVKLISADLRPYSIQEGGRSGLIADVVIEIERRLGSNRSIDFLPWSRSQRRVMSQPNHLIFPLTRTADREAHYNWLIKVAPIELVFVTLNGTVLSVEDAQKLEKISVHQDTPFEYFLKEHGFKNIVRVHDSFLTHISLLQKKRTQGWFTAKDIAIYWGAETDLKEALTFSEALNVGDLYIATSKVFPKDVALAYQHAFQEMAADGTYAAILDRYRGYTH